MVKFPVLQRDVPMKFTTRVANRLMLKKSSKHPLNSFTTRLTGFVVDMSGGPNFTSFGSGIAMVLSCGSNFTVSKQCRKVNVASSYDILPFGQKNRYKTGHIGQT
jgi:hypothetical protein